MKITLTNEVEEHLAISPEQKRLLEEIAEKVPFYELAENPRDFSCVKFKCV